MLWSCLTTQRNAVDIWRTKVNHRVFKDNQYTSSLQATMAFVTSIKHPPDDLPLPPRGREDEFFVQSYHSATKLEMSLDSNSIRYKRDEPSQDDCSFHLHYIALGPMSSNRTWAPGGMVHSCYPRERQFCPFNVALPSIKNTLCSFRLSTKMYVGKCLSILLEVSRYG